MPTTYLLTLYQYDELDEAAQARARDWLRSDSWSDYDWWDFVYSDFIEIVTGPGQPRGIRRGDPLPDVLALSPPGTGVREPARGWLRRRPHPGQ